MATQFKVGDQVKVDTDVYMGDRRWVRAACPGIVERVFTKTLHVNLDYVDGYFRMTVSVPKKDCQPLTD